MRGLVAFAAWVLAACAGSADAGDQPDRKITELPSLCVPSADETLWLPAVGSAVAAGSRDGAYGKSCGGARDDRWIAELVDAGSAAFRVQAIAADGREARVELAVYGWIAPRWIDREYVPGHWQMLGESRGPDVAWAVVDAGDDAVPYSLVRIAARAVAGEPVPVTVAIAR
ncbi:MAG: hypothetical protein ACXVDD_23445 [Polyangia bacterium]